MMKNGQISKPLSNTSDDKLYKRLGLKQGKPEPWEDGIRTSGGRGTYEWWYTDAEFVDGTTIVVVFFTKYGFDVKGPSQPMVTIEITLPDGSSIRKFFSEDSGSKIIASTEKADVQIGDSYLRDVGGAYEIKFKSEGIEYETLMETTIPMWRPETGYSFFGDKQKHFFAWVVPQPASMIKGTLKVDGRITELSGTGYHDHNWGNTPMNKVINHWYWGRAKINEYNIITADIISEKKYGYTRMPVIMIAKDGEVIADDQNKLTVTRSDAIQHPKTGKFMDNHIIFDLAGPNNTDYRIEYLREKDISVVSFLDLLPRWQKFLAKLIGANPTYVRTLGKVRLTITKNGYSTSFEQDGLWEQMFFGRNKKAIIKN